MKKIVFLLAVLLLSTFASWAAELSFTIYPQYSGNFRIFYSTYNAPAEFAVTVDWGNEEYYNYPKAETGSDPNELIQGSVIKGTPIKIYSNYLDAIYIVENVEAIKCEANNPQLEYIYYFNDNLSPEKLEALYLSLISRNGKTGFGELHLSTSTSIETASANILKSNAFIPEGINWRVCSKKAWTGSTSARINWKLDEANCKTHLIPAFTISTATTANIDLQLAVSQNVQLPYKSPVYWVRIDDGTSNHKNVPIPEFYSDDWNYFSASVPKRTVKGVVTPGTIKIYGAMVSGIITKQISTLNLSNTSNMRHIDVRNSSNLTAIPGLSSQPLLQNLHLYGNTNLTSVDVQNSPKLTDLGVNGCYKLSQLYFNRTSLEYLSFSQCSKLKLASLSNLSDATKLTLIIADDLGWDACAMDELYRALRSPAPSGAEIFVHDDDAQGGSSSDWKGSNKTIATAKGWSVMGWYNGGAEQKLTGDGGGCSLTNIPDIKFFNALKDLKRTNGAVGQEIPTINLSGITTLDVSNKGIKDLTGIQDFTALTGLNCSENQLGKLDVTKNTALQILACHDNGLKVLDVTKNTALIILTCNMNSLSVLDVSKNTDLGVLHCSANNLLALDVSKNTKLIQLDCNDNDLTSLDVRNGNNSNVTDFNALNNPNLSCIYVNNKTASYLSGWQKDSGTKFVNNASECGGTVAYTNIPDTNFLQALKDLGHGAGAVGHDIPTANLSGIKSLNLLNKSISDLTGIQAFVALEFLNLHSNPLVSIDVSKNTALKELDCEACRLTSLNVSKNTALTLLVCSQNKLQSLDVTKNIALTELWCGSSNFPVLDLSKNIKLTKINCANGQFSSLDMRNGNNSNVTDFNAGVNPNLSCIYVDNKTASYLSGWRKDAGAKWANNESECGVTVAYTNIPDTNFLNALIALGHGAGAVGHDIPTANLSGITTLDISSKSISNLTGIEDFIDLKNFTSRYNTFKHLDLSANTALETLTCTYQGLLSLDISKCKALTNLICSNNNLANLDVTANKALKSLECGANQLTSLDMRNGNNSNVTDFNAVVNPNLTCIYVDNKTASYLSGWIKDATAKFANTESECGVTVAYTNIPDANFLQALKDLGHGAGAVDNDIPTANLSAITTLNISNKNISSLTGIKDFAALEILRCDGNNLTNLDVSKNKALTSLDCEQNQITILNVSGNIALITLNCADNAMESIYLLKNTALEELICYENQLESIDVSKNTKLKSLKCSSNLIPILDLSKNTALTDLDCVENDLKTLDLSKNTALKQLDCRYNEILVLDISMNTKLTALNCNDNKLISLDVRNGNNVNVTYFDATNNPNLSCIYVDDKTASYLTDWAKDANAKFVNTEAECGTGVNDVVNQAITIFPNPTKGILQFDLSGENVQKIMILDIMGKTVLEKNKLNQDETVNLSGFANGLYMVILQTNNGSKSYKLIKE